MALLEGAYTFDECAVWMQLYCCWCAQDIEANRFWESMGFVPLAFRAGSREEGRVHIFWQKRIRAGDETTPYWFPAQTSQRSDSGGSAGAADSAGDALARCDADCVAGSGVDTTTGVSPAICLGRRKTRWRDAVLQKPTKMRKQFAPPSAKPAPDARTARTGCEEGKAKEAEGEERPQAGRCGAGVAGSVDGEGQ
jgi:hypothetical protein